jgi:uncharacterized protein (TIGR02117 family)
MQYSWFARNFGTKKGLAMLLVLKRIRRLLRLTIQGIVFLIGCYACILLLGLLPKNVNFQPPQADGITIYVTSSSVHADLFLPVRFEEVDWRREFEHIKTSANIDLETYVAIGWGDRGFYLETETWDDLKLSTTFNALLLPSRSCIHIDYTSPNYYPSAKRITITAEQYRDLVEYIRRSIKRDEKGHPIQIRGFAYGQTDAFIEAHGSYHLLNTCNSWIGRALAKGGVRTPWLTPLPHTPTLYLD